MSVRSRPMTGNARKKRHQIRSLNALLLSGQANSRFKPLHHYSWRGILRSMRLNSRRNAVQNGCQSREIELLGIFVDVLGNNVLAKILGRVAAPAISLSIQFNALDLAP